MYEDDGLGLHVGALVAACFACFVMLAWLVSVVVNKEDAPERFIERCESFCEDRGILEVFADQSGGGRCVCMEVEEP